MIHPPRSRFLPASSAERRTGPIFVGLVGLWLAIAGLPANAEIDCGMGRIEITSRGPQVVQDGDRGDGGRNSGASERPFFDRVCNEFIDTEHFRLHYSTLPGSVAIGTAMDVAVSGERALVAAGTSGIQIVDIAVPGAPIVVGNLAVPGSAWRVVADGHLAAVLAGDDVHVLRTGDSPALAGRISFPSSPRSLAIQGLVVYVVTGSGLQIIDVSAPETPVQVATLLLPGDPRDVAVAGTRIAVAMGDAGVAIIDASDPGQLQIEAIVDTPASATGVAIEDVLYDELVYVADGPGGLVVLSGFEGWKMVGSLSLGAVSRVVVRDHHAYVTRLGRRLALVHAIHPDRPLLLDQAVFFGEVTGVALGEAHAYVAVPGSLQIVSTIDPEGGTWIRPVRDQIPGWPSTALRDSLAVAFEHAYDIFQNMGFQPPLSDGDLGGGRDLIDSYIFQLPQDGGVAYTHPEDPVAGDCSRSFNGHIGIDNLAGFTSVTRLKDVAAHELFHLVQIAYDRFETSWFLESTAVWAEEHVRPSQTLAGDVRCWFNTPYLSLWSSLPVCRMYGSVHFWLFEEQMTDATIVRRCLERGCPFEVDWRSALIAELAVRGLDFNRQLGEFARWNYRTGERADGEHYTLTLPGIDFQGEHAHYPVTNGGVDPVAESTGTNYVRFLGPGRRDTLRVTFSSDPRLVEWREVTLVATRAPNRHREWILDLGKEGRASAIIPDWPSYDSACLIVANGDSSGSALGPVDYAFSYSAVETGPAPFTSVARPGPSPTATQSTIAWRLAEESAHVKLDIYDLSGRLVRRLADQTFDRGDHQLTWDGTSEDDRRAPSGVYFYRLDLAGSLYRGRILLVR
jgi:hypothetical protein